MDDQQQDAGRTAVAVPQPTPPPVERVLAVVRRSDTEQLRIVWSTYQDRPFISIGWWAYAGGSWRLDRTRRFSVRLRELGQLVAGLGAAQLEADAFRARWREQQDLALASYGSNGGVFPDGKPI